MRVSQLHRVVDQSRFGDDTRGTPNITLECPGAWPGVGTTCTPSSI